MIAADTVVGYCTGDDILCADCVGAVHRDFTPIFVGDDNAAYECSECGETLMESYTGVAAERDPDTGEILSDEEVHRRREQEIAYQLGEERPEEAEERLRMEAEAEEKERDRLKEIEELEAMLAKLKKGET